MDIPFYRPKQGMHWLKYIKCLLAFIFPLQFLPAQNVTSLNSYLKEPLSAGIYANNYLAINGTIINRILIGYNFSLFNENITEQNNILDLRYFILNRNIVKLSAGYIGVARFNPFVMKNFLLAGGNFDYKRWRVGIEALWLFEDPAFKWNVSAGIDVWRKMYCATSIGYNKHTLYSELEYGLGIFMKEGRFSGSIAGFIPLKHGLDRFLISTSLYITIIQSKKMLQSPE